MTYEQIALTAFLVGVAHVAGVLFGHRTGIAAGEKKVLDHIAKGIAMGEISINQEKIIENTNKSTNV